MTFAVTTKTCFNRTFMELKFQDRLLITVGYACFNRTFMELK